MSIAELVFLLLSRKKALIKFVLGSTITYGAYVGAIRPSSAKAVTEVDGSNILQGKNRHSIKLAKAPIPKVHNVLELTSLKNLEQNQARFHPSLSKYLDNKKIFEKQSFSWWKSNVGAIGEIIDSEQYCLSCANLSDREVIYGDTYFSDKVAELGEAELVQDILWSLWEESKYNGTVIHAETIKVDLQLDKTSKPSIVKQFSLSFKVSNLSTRKAQVLRKIDLDPYTQAEINVLLSNGEIRSTPVATGHHGLKYTTWNLFPKNTQWKVVKNIQQPKKQTATSSHDSLQLIYGESRFIPHSISRNTQRRTAINTIDYAYVKDKLSPFLNSITADDIEKDIESWYGGYFAYLIRTRIDDIQNLIELLQKKTIENDRGIKESVFEQVLNNYQFRNNLYNHFKFSDTYKKALNKLLTNDGNKGIRITIEEITGLLKSWVYQLKQIQDSIKVEIEWKEKPKKVYSQAGQYGEYPTFAFNFEQKITWVKEMKIPLNGIWSIKKNKYEELSTGSTGSTEDGKHKFNITNKLTNLKDILAPLTSVISSLNQSLEGINVMDDLIPDVGKFIGIDALTINENESISYIYKTTGSPITLALDDISDLQEKHFPRMNIGWKAIDVSAALNLSKFTKLFHSLYEKFDSGIKERQSLGFIELTKAGDELKKSPISFIAHAINSIFDKSYGSGSSQRQDETKRPWPVFFRSLFADPLVFDRAQMMTGYSRLFFKYPEWWGKDNKLDKDCKGQQQQQQQQQQHWCTSFDFSKRNKIAEPKNYEVDLISRSLTFNHSMYAPYSPIVLNNISGGQYEKFLGDEGAGKTSQGVLNGTKEIVEAVKQNYNKNSFVGKREIDWGKAKVSFAQLNLKKAIESVLALENTWSGLVSGTALNFAGIYFHKILGEALVRDGFWININLMHEHGIFTKHDVKVTKKMNYYPNSEIWLKVDPSLDHEKLNLGWLANLFLQKK
ncbi:hypothetical protein A6V39_01695 [Candidatus Mycoplasma haematobovis]|uniref:Uncharacterized protein n=1 Tax=Candidatus Mycoplasma haematobovis TaxID=432608 RepID=A0A1A9QFN3_9MOLU|nr:hypothetical protein [Candidatus Mycoplasma haematobovis]OAL10756.1 hypothetical protein A6V39_01695 [Candidatus Mycoplasma haematobovis]